ncbi:MAG: hypothetical protein R3A13_08590 [Bdellovibrionota bacterium]
MMGVENFELKAMPTEAAEKLRRELKTQTSFLRDLVRMGEEPYEIETQVSMAANYCTFRAMSLFAEHGYTTERLEYFSVIKNFFEFVYLVDHGKRRYTIENVSKRLIDEFIDLIIVEPPLEKVSTDDLDVYDTMKYAFYALEDSGLDQNFNSKIAHINLLHKRALKATGFKKSKSFKAQTEKELQSYGCLSALKAFREYAVAFENAE